MKKTLFYLFGICILCGCATNGGVVNPQFVNTQISSVGVVQFFGEEKKAILLTDKFSTGLIKLGFSDFRIIDNQQVNRILKEQNIRLNNIMDINKNDNRQKIGKFANVDAIFVGSFKFQSGAQLISNDIILEVKLIDIKTGDVIYSCTSNSAEAIGLIGTPGEIANIVVNAILKDTKKSFK